MNNETILLKDLQDLLSNKAKYLQGNQGEYNETFKFYKHPGIPNGVFMRETYYTDSYGSNQNLVAVEFVKGKEKTITVFEPM